LAPRWGWLVAQGLSDPRRVTAHVLTSQACELRALGNGEGALPSRPSTARSRSRPSTSTCAAVSSGTSPSVRLLRVSPPPTWPTGPGAAPLAGGSRQLVPGPHGADGPGAGPAAGASRRVVRCPAGCRRSPPVGVEPGTSSAW
jgi:hypothetical protein